MKNTALKIAFVLLSVSGLAQCGDDDSLSSKVTITFLPDNPIVVNADLTLYPGQDNELEVKAPWFISSSRIVNSSERRLSVVTYKYVITAVKNGAPITSEAYLDPSITCDDDDAGRAYLAVLDPDETYQNLTDPCDPETVTTSAAASYSGKPYERYYLDSLPEADTSFYNIEISAEGWFEDADGIPLERLTATGFVSTQ